MTPNSLKISLGIYLLFFVLLSVFPSFLSSLSFLRIIIIHAHLIWVFLLSYQVFKTLRLKKADLIIMAALLILSLTVRIQFSGHMDSYDSGAIGEQNAVFEALKGVDSGNPFGYSALLTYPLLIFGLTAPVLHAFNIFLASLAGIIIYLLFREITGSRVFSVGVAAIFLLERHFIYWSGTGNSTSTFVLFFALALLFLARSLKSGKHDKAFLVTLFFIPNIRSDALILILPLILYWIFMKKRVPVIEGLLLLPSLFYFFRLSPYTNGSFLVGIVDEGTLYHVINAALIEFVHSSLVPGIILGMILLTGVCFSFKDKLVLPAIGWYLFALMFTFLTIGYGGMQYIFDEYVPRRLIMTTFAFGVSLWAVMKITGRMKAWFSAAIFSILIIIQILSLPLIYDEHKQTFYEEELTANMVTAAASLGVEAQVYTGPMHKFIGSLIRRLANPPTYVEKTGVVQGTYYLEPEFCWKRRIRDININERKICAKSRSGLELEFQKEIGLVRIYVVTK